MPLLSRARLLAAAALLTLFFGRAAEVAACVPYADAVVAWDLDADLYVVATYNERPVPPAPRQRVFPNLLELRRLSTGVQIRVVNCSVSPGSFAADAAGPCDFRAMFGGLIPKTAGFVRRGRALPRGRLSIQEVREGAGSGFALMAKPRGNGGGGRAHRVRWLAHSTGTSSERMSLRLGDSEIWQQDVAVVVETRYRAGACKHTEAKLLRLRQSELAQPGGPAQQHLLLARLNLSSSFDDWRSAADLGPLPPEKLVFAMVVAAEAGRQDLAARWWREGTADLPLARVAVLASALRQRPELVATRQLITLPPEP